jgi:hypothetical protein
VSVVLKGLNEVEFVLWRLAEFEVGAFSKQVFEA